MRYAVFSDIHGNLEALDVVLAHAAQEEKVDAYVCLGDIVGYCANPVECIERVQALDCIVIAGNHDWAAIEQVDIEYFNYYAREAILWTRAHMRPEDTRYLKELPLVIIEEKFTACHGSLYRPETFGYITTAYDAHLAFDALSTQIGFMGHSHIPVTFFSSDGITFSLDSQIFVGEDEKALVNVGSVGQPRDENPLACYAIYDDTTSSVDIHRLEYDIDLAARKIRENGIPGVLADRLFLGQ